jgi:hypothetical protein
VTDPPGDTNVKGAPAYQDIVEAEVTKVTAENGEVQYIFRNRMAGPLTIQSILPSNPGGIKEVMWDWGISTDETTFSKGYPFSGIGNTSAYDFMLFLGWDGQRFAGALLDRRPLLIDEHAVLSKIDFALDGADILLFVPATRLGNPEKFLWRCGSVDLVAGSVSTDPDSDLHNGASNSLNGMSGFHSVDTAGFPFTAFP